MSSAGISENISEYLEDDDARVRSYSAKFSRPQLDRFAQNAGVEIQGDRVSEDIRTLLEDGSLGTFHEYFAKLYRIGPDTIVEGIKKIDRPRLSDISDEEMGDKTALIIYLIEWEWEEEVELIRSLRDFKNKRTYKRKQIRGERRFDGLTDNALEALRDEVEEVLGNINDHQRYKVDLHRMDMLERRTLVVRFLAESKSSSYRQFRFREEDDVGFEQERSTEVVRRDYWPVKPEHVYLDYGRNEYYENIKRSADHILEGIVGALYDDGTFGEDVSFVNPLEFGDKTPKEFVDTRVREQRKAIDESDLLTDEKKDDYLSILDDLQAAEQTRIKLENIDVEGDPLTIEVDTEQDISTFLAAQGWEDQIEELNQKSGHREYTLRLGNREIDVAGTRITITGDVTEDEEHILTSLLREDSATI